jgi:hypothetical protein
MTKDRWKGRKENRRAKEQNMDETFFFYSNIKKKDVPSLLAVISSCRVPAAGTSREPTT